MKGRGDEVGRGRAGDSGSVRWEVTGRRSGSATIVQRFYELITTFSFSKEKQIYCSSRRIRLPGFHLT